MTPDAVLQRYVHVVNAEPLDVEALARLVGADADLLGRWISLLGCRVSAAGLAGAMAELDDPTLRSLAQAQVWAVMPIGGAPRLSYAQWCAVVRSASLGEGLANEIGLVDSESVRLQILLVVSGVQIGHDPLMRELFEFRTAPPALLAEAHPVLRILAVVEAQTVRGQAAASDLAADLLSVSSAAYSDTLMYADASTEGLIAGLGIRDEEETDWAEKLWMRQQIMAFSNVISLQPTAEALHEVHRLISAELFRQTPMTFLVDDDRQIVLQSKDELAPVRLDVTRSQSVVARCLRDRAVAEQPDDDRSAVIDRQFMRRLGKAGLLAVPMVDEELDIGVLLFGLDEDHGATDIEAMTTYVRSFAHWLAAERRQENAIRQFAKTYREANEKRLREIVHEANNPLSIVHNYLHILELRLQEDAGTTEQIRLIRDEITRAAEIVRRAVDFPDATTAAAEPAATFARTNLGDAVERVCRLIEPDAQHRGVAVTVHSPATALSLSTDANRLTQILINLVRNAIEALEHGGEVTVASVGGVFRAGREGVEVIVADDGPGLPRTVLERLFQPKRSSKGGDHAGLGLHIVAQIVEELQGNIDVRTTPDTGTAFTVFLPLAPL